MSTDRMEIRARRTLVMLHDDRVPQDDPATPPFSDAACGARIAVRTCDGITVHGRAHNAPQAASLNERIDPQRATSDASPRRSHVRPSRPRRHGIIFVTAMWVMVILGALVLIFARSTRVDLIAATNRQAIEQAAAVELGAEQYVLSVVDASNGDALTVLSASAEQMQVGDGYFWIVRPDPDEEQTYAYGITDESSKLNLNVAADAELALLPNMTQDVADAIVDWRDADATVTGQGAENDYYQSLPRPYMAKNGPMETVEEALLVRGIDENLMWGYDYNRNGVIDPAEQSAGGTATVFNSAGSGSRGLFPFVSVWGNEPNTDATGKARVNVADPGSAGALRTLIIAQGIAEQRADQILAFARARGGQFKSVFDFAQKAQLQPDEFEKLADHLTTSTAKTLPGLININTAPKQVLTCLPGIEENDAESIIAHRGTTSSASGSSSSGLGLGGIGSNGGSNALTSGTSSSDATSIGWLLQTITPAKAAAIGARITGRSYFFSADIVGVSGDGRAYKRCRIVVDARSSPPKIVYRKDLTSLGWPLSDDLRTTLRSGQGLSTFGGSAMGGATMR